MNIPTFGAGRVESRAGIVLAIVLALAGAAQARFGSNTDGLRLDAVFDAATSLLPRATSSDDVDLHDGRSPVPRRWRESFVRFALDDGAPVAAGGRVVFVGSSSIDYWPDLPAQFPQYPVIQRGLAGATMADCLRHADRLIVPSRPRLVVVYAGDNDLAAGVEPERIVADYAALVRAVRREVPTARFVFVSIKPSPSRRTLMPLVARTNALIAAQARGDPRLAYVDVFTPMLTAESRARAELFGADGLHMTPAGYALWRDALAGPLAAAMKY